MWLLNRWGIYLSILKLEKEKGPPRTLHRNLLKPCGSLPETEREEQNIGRPQRPRMRRQNAIWPDEEPFDTASQIYDSW